MIFVVVGLAFVMSVTPKPFIEAQGASMEKDPAQTNMKRLLQRMLCGKLTHKAMARRYLLFHKASEINVLQET